MLHNLRDDLQTRRAGDGGCIARFRAADDESNRAASQPTTAAPARPADRRTLVAPAVLYLLVLFIIPIGYVLLLERHRSDGVARELPAAVHRAALHRRDAQHLQGVAHRHARLPALGYPLAYVMARRNDCGRGHLSGRRRHELLDRLRGAHLRVADHSRQQGAGDRLYAASPAWGAPPQLLFTSFSSTSGHDPHPAALHGARALRRHAQDRAVLSARRRKSRRQAADAHSATSFCRSACPAWSTAACSSSPSASASTSRRSCSARRGT